MYCIFPSMVFVIGHTNCCLICSITLFLCRIPVNITLICLAPYRHLYLTDSWFWIYVLDHYIKCSGFFILILNLDIPCRFVYCKIMPFYHIYRSILLDGIYMNIIISIRLECCIIRWPTISISCSWYPS